MPYINKGDLLMSRSGKKYIAASADYTKRIAGNGEYLDDWSIVGAVDVLDPETGSKSWFRLGDVTKL
jgi:hypothetical protein